jgi:hypothetical protein
MPSYNHFNQPTNYHMHQPPQFHQIAHPSYVNMGRVELEQGPGSFITVPQYFTPNQPVQQCVNLSYLAQSQQNQNRFMHTGNQPLQNYQLNINNSTQYAQPNVPSINAYQAQTFNQQSGAIKLEPYEPGPFLNGRNVSNTNSNYFTNPIPFKQEPSEQVVVKQEASDSTNADGQSSTSSDAGQQSAALNIVNHLLKDKQILNQLEKVAQSFRLN